MNIRFSHLADFRAFLPCPIRHDGRRFGARHGFCRGPATAQLIDGGLVVVNVSNVANNLAQNLSVDISRIPVRVQVPVGIAANVCPNIDANVLARQRKEGGEITRTATNASHALTQIVGRNLKPAAGQ
jgi:hypothetical protein